MKHKQPVVNSFRSAVFYVQVELWQFRHQTALQNSLVKFEPFLVHGKNSYNFLTVRVTFSKIIQTFTLFPYFTHD